jgi:hypothetical protein
MKNIRSDIIRGAAIGLGISASGVVFIFPFLIWKSNQAPEYFGAFIAAIVAAVAVIVGAHYQAILANTAAR